MCMRGSCKTHEEKWRKKFVGQRLGVTPKSWLLIWNFVVFCSFFYMNAHVHDAKCSLNIMLSLCEFAGYVGQKGSNGSRERGRLVSKNVWRHQPDHKAKNSKFQKSQNLGRKLSNPGKYNKYQRITWVPITILQTLFELEYIGAR